MIAKPLLALAASALLAGGTAASAQSAAPLSLSSRAASSSNCSLRRPETRKGRCGGDQRTAPNRPFVGVEPSGRVYSSNQRANC